MKVPLSWLKELISTTLSAEEIADQLVLLGIEVDAIEARSLGFEGVVVGEVRECKPHPDADKLKVAKVFDGQEEFQVVCGAPNCRKGLKTAFARVGAKIQGSKIKKGKLRGVESQGMLCSETELGIGDDDQGIAELPELALGEEVYGDTIIEVSLTPNLGHCLSILGIARELAAKTGETVTLPTPPPIETKGVAPISVSIEAKECSRYACRVIRGVKVGPSPHWLRSRVDNPVNNIADVTNYVMMAIGQPMHAFDMAKIAGSEIVVRHSRPGETFDGEKIAAETLIIADEKRPIALAGVKGEQMGNQTVDIVLESAHFDPSAVRRTSKNTQISTESSRRFERGCDPEQVSAALDLATALILEIAGGVAMESVDVMPKPIPARQIELRSAWVNRVLGTTLSQEDIASLLERLDFKMSGKKVRIPSYRSDIKGEIDLIEEVARLYGYNEIPKRALPIFAHEPSHLFQNAVREQLIGQGLAECITSSLIGRENEGVRVLNPTSIDHSVLRTTLLPGLLNVVELNRRMQNHDLALFEIGQVHPELKVEHTHAAIVLAGKTPHHFSDKRRDIDFLDLKGILENLFSLTYKPSKDPRFHPHRQASLLFEGNPVGCIGEVLKPHCLVAELNLDLLAFPTQRMEQLPQYPGSDRDWTLTLAEDVATDEVLLAIAPSRLLKEIELIAIYRSEAIGEGWKNVTFRFHYRDDRKTLAQKAVDAEHQRIMNSVLEKVRCKT